jgi:ankyrin repeat protein
VAIYEELLRRDSLRGAFGLWQEDQVLDEVSTDEEGWPLLLLLMDDGLFDVAAQMLMEAEADVRTATEDGFTAYHVIGNCDGDEIGELRAMDFNETLQMYNLSPDDRDEDGDRPLDIAAMSDNWDAFEFLLDAGANVKLPDFNIEALLDSMRGYGFESLADRVEKLAGHKKPAAKRAPRKKKEN